MRRITILFTMLFMVLSAPRASAQWATFDASNLAQAVLSFLQDGDNMAVNSAGQTLPDDSTVYGLACEGCTDSLLILLPLDGSDPDTFNIFNAQIQHKIFGRPTIGDQMAVIRNAQDSTTADLVINIDRLQGEWRYLVTPRLRRRLADSSALQQPVNLPDSFVRRWLQPKEYGYDIFNSEDPFYNDKCTKFTTHFDSDITLKLRNELYLLYAKISCSDKCLYDTFDENNDTIYCNCNFAGESKKENELETERFNIKVVKCIRKSFNDIMKNYIFIAICILSFSFIICFFITCISLSKTISEYSKEFSGLKKKFSKYYYEVIKKEDKIKEAKEKEKLSQKEKLKVKNKKDLNEIEEEEDNDDNEDENDKDDENDEQEEESDEGNNKQLKINKNNINPMNNPFFNSVPNNSMTPYNAYDQFFLYQMYQQYMMNYMHNLYFNNNTINNNRNDDEDEDEADEEDSSCFRG